MGGKGYKRVSSGEREAKGRECREAGRALGWGEERPEGKDTKGHQQEGAGGSGKEREEEKSRWGERHSWPREQRGKSRKKRARQRKGLEGEREEAGSGEVQIAENLREAERGGRGMQISEGGAVTEGG